jgi:hypothetical protein
MRKKLSGTTKSSPAEVLRFAHPFYTVTPIGERSVIKDVGSRMTDYIKTQLLPVPKPTRDPTMLLSEIIGKAGVSEIESAKLITFHAVGDTGIETGNTQQMVADAMSSDYNVTHPSTSPAFFFHLGDVNYYDNTDKGYHAQFYEPYKTYPGKIIAIPGNHDGELFKWDGSSVGQKVTLGAFMENFCQLKAGVPPAAGTIYREMISQPGVYWYLNAPFVDVIGLYSNMAENPGYISAPSIGYDQKKWLTNTLTKILAARNTNERKALIIATHHPPLSNGNHGSSTEMLIDIDDSCTKAGIMPDVFLSAHAHNIQCYSRYVTFGGKALMIPFIVCGSGGRQIQSVRAADGKKVTDATALSSYHTFDKCLNDYGYLVVTVAKSTLTINIYQVKTPGIRTLFNSIRVNLNK